MLIAYAITQLGGIYLLIALLSLPFRWAYRAFSGRDPEGRG